MGPTPDGVTRKRARARGLPASLSRKGRPGICHVDVRHKRGVCPQLMAASNFAGLVNPFDESFDFYSLTLFARLIIGRRW